MTDLQKKKISETLKDFKCLVPRYLEVKDNKQELRLFCVRNRNPLWDISGWKMFKTGLYSRNATLGDALVDDHIIQRSDSMLIIFNKLLQNINIGEDEFLKLLLKVSSTVKITRNEHKIVTKLAKNNPGVYNYMLYDKAGIVIEGLDEYINDNL